MKKWQCRFCSHVYDEALGEPMMGVEPGTRLEDLPDDWYCHECGATRDDYEEIIE